MTEAPLCLTCVHRRWKNARRTRPKQKESCNFSVMWCSVCKGYDDKRLCFGTMPYVLAMKTDTQAGVVACPPVSAGCKDFMGQS